MEPLRILHVVPFGPEAWAYGGIPRVVDALTAGLSRRGHQVTIVTTDACDRERRLPARERPPYGTRRAVGAGSIELRQFPNLSNRLAYHLQLFLPRGMRRELERNAGFFDVAHLHAYRNFPTAFAAAACERRAIPFVTTPNGTVPRIEARRSAKALWDLVMGHGPIERAARLLAVTEHERRELVAQISGMAGGADSAQIELLPNPVELGEFEPRPEAGAFRARHGLGSGPIVLYLGRISPRKRLDLLVRAFAGLRDRETTLVVAGSEMGDAEPYRRALREAKLGGRVRELGTLTGRERLEALADADAVAYATEAEIFGLVPLEAILCGTPVVVADDSGCGELVRGVGGGIVAPAGDATALAHALEDLLGRTTFWRGEVASAARRVRALYGADVIAARLETIYREVIEEGRGRPRRPAQTAAASGASIS